MNKILFLWLLLWVIVFSNGGYSQSERAVRRAAQTGKAGISKEEIVSMKADVPYAQAIQMLGEMARKLEDRILIDRSPMRENAKPIGLNIEAMYWKDALELILRSNQLWYNDYPEYIEILAVEELLKQQQAEQPIKSARIEEQKPQLAPAVTGIPDTMGRYIASQREITISSIFFQLDRTRLAEKGVSFSIFRGKNLNLGVEFAGAGEVIKPIFTVGASPRGSKMVVDIDAALAMMEGENLGEVISRPEITVRAGNTGRIQIGTDFSVKEKDFAGNTVERFYPSGTILTVTPKILKVNDVEFIDLNYTIERSTVTTGATSTLLDKTQASGTLSLLNGEESYVGGLYTNEEVIIRTGVPFLKDLPWWFFGLRYIFGYDKKQTIRKELIVLLRAKFLPLVEERAAMVEEEKKNIIQEKLQESTKEIKGKTTVK
ncbi:MAG: type II and III secretion system protein [Bacteroidetes bacterium]|nr:type II and III secretion system protein [Bacteroidota bacterium]